MLTIIALHLLAAGCSSTSDLNGVPQPALGVSDESAAGTSTISLPRSSDDVIRVEFLRQPWRFADEHDGEIITTPHYQLYTTLEDQFLLELMPLFLERAIVHYTTAMGVLPSPTTPMEMFLLGRRDQWVQKTREMLPNQADTYLNLGRGGYTTQGKSILFYIGQRDTLAIAAHEGWHQYTQTTFKQSLPVWLEESLATYMEGYERRDGTPRFRPWRNLERYYTLRDAVRRDRLIPLKDLLSQSPQQFLDGGTNRLLTYYAQLWALAHFLAEGEDGRYREGLRQALLDAASDRLTETLVKHGQIPSNRRGAATMASRSGPWVLFAYFNQNLNEFETEYLAFVDEIIQRENRWQIEQGVSPLQD